MGNARKGTRARVQSGSMGFCELKEKEEKFEKRLRKIGGESKSEIEDEGQGEERKIGN